MNLEPEKSKGVAYLLLVVGPMFGLCGLQRLYMGLIGTGVLYVLTFGFLGIGQLVDLFTFGRVVENHNLTIKLRKHYDSERATTGKFGPSDGLSSDLSQQLTNLRKLGQAQRERALLQFIHCKKGMISPIEIVSVSSLNMEEAKRELDNFCVQGAAELRITEGGEMLYVFPGFLDEEEKRKARSVLSV